MPRPRRRIAKIKDKGSRRPQILKTRRQSLIDTSPWALPAFYIAFIIGMAAVVVFVLFFSGFFSVKAVTLLDNDQISEDEVREVLDRMMKPNYLLVLPGESILLLDPVKTAETLSAEIASIETATVEKQLPQTLKIKLVERKPAAVWRSGGQFYYIDQRGLVLAEVGEATRPEDSRLPVILDANNYPVKVNETIIGPEFLNALAIIRERFPTKLNIDVKEVYIPELGPDITPSVVDELRIKTSEGWEVYFDLNRPIETQIAVLLKVLKEEIGDRKNLSYVDLRVKDRVFYK